MFLNIFNRVVVKKGNLWNHSTYIQQFQCMTTKLRTDADEIKDAVEIEANLFDNSSHVYKPIKKEEVLKARKTTTTTRHARNQNITNVTQIKPKSIGPKLIKDAELGLQFYRLNLNDPIIAKLMTIVRSRKRYIENAKIVVEGRRLIQEAIENNLHMETLLFSQQDELQKLSALVAKTQTQQNTQIYKLAQHDLKMWSTLTSPPGLLAVFRRPTNLIYASSDALPITVICDNIREPNNLGSIVRTCAALPCKQVLVTRGCCDPWESKALRGGCGGHFRVPICDGLNWSQLPQLFHDVKNELCVFVAENNVCNLERNAADTIEYANITHFGQHNIVIIGGESHGVSDEAYNFLSTFSEEKRKCVYIPLADGVDSLNVVSALTLILYELRKHLVNQIQ